MGAAPLAGSQGLARVWPLGGCFGAVRCAMNAHPTGGVAADSLRAADIFEQMKSGKADGMA